MIIYTGAIFWILLIQRLSKNRIALTQPQHVTKGAAMLMMAYLVFFIGLRGTGGDTAAYIRSYRYYTDTGLWKALTMVFSFQDESLFEGLAILTKTVFGSSYVPFLFIVAAISGFGMSHVLYKKSEAFFTSMILFVLWGNWSWMINGIRQFLAAVLAFMCISLIEDKKAIRYMICILLLSRIHFSVIMMIPLYFFVKAEPWKKETALLILVVIAAVLFTNRFLGALDTIMEGTEYEGYLTGEYFTNNSGSNPIRTLVFAVPTVIAYANRKEIEKKAPQLIKICVNMSIVCVCVSTIANVTSGIYIGRLPIYFSLYNLILLPWMYIHILNDRKRNIASGTMVLYSAYYVFENYFYSHPYYLSEVLHLFIR